jgi:CheY-like chemotaxis protein
MNGDRAARLIREREAATGLPRIPILLTSGYSSGERFPAVVDGFLAKPYTLDQLVSTVIGVGWPSSEGSVRESNGWPERARPGRLPGGGARLSQAVTPW